MGGGDSRIAGLGNYVVDLLYGIGIVLFRARGRLKTGFGACIYRIETACVADDALQPQGRGGLGYVGGRKGGKREIRAGEEGVGVGGREGGSEEVRK